MYNLNKLHPGQRFKGTPTCTVKKSWTPNALFLPLLRTLGSSSSSYSPPPSPSPSEVRVLSDRTPRVLPQHTPGGVTRPNYTYALLLILCRWNLGFETSLFSRPDPSFLHSRGSYLSVVHSFLVEGRRCLFWVVMAFPSTVSMYQSGGTKFRVGVVNGRCIRSTLKFQTHETERLRKLYS